ncbi:hypothetical protein NB689_000339 [Xanthomonas sacchari]|nr:hypothetical protein [Xanthomonas sacchari]
MPLRTCPSPVRRLQLRQRGQSHAHALHAPAALPVRPARSRQQSHLGDIPAAKRLFPVKRWTAWRDATSDSQNASQNWHNTTAIRC